MKSLSEMYETTGKLVEMELPYLLNPESRQRATQSFSGYHQTRAVYAFFEKGDLQKARQEFYTAGRLMYYRIKQLSQPQVLSYATMLFGDSLLSNNSALIAELSVVSGFSNLYIEAMQAIVRNDVEALGAIKTEFMDIRHKPEHNIQPLADNCIQVIDGFLSGNMAAISHALKEMDNPELLRSRALAQGTVAAQYISHPTTGFAKQFGFPGLL